VVMPRRSGLSLLAAVREDPATQNIPVVLLTSRSETQATVEGFKAGANDYVGKPFVPAELLTRVEAQLRVREAAVRAAQSERLASLGLLSSGFAHEVRNPLNGLINALEPLRELLPVEAPPLARELLDLATTCSERILQLSQALLLFARPAEATSEVELASCLDSTLQVLAWRMPLGVEVERVYGPVPPIFADGGALNQVWLNLIDNALHAVGDRGKLRVAVAELDGKAVVQIEDDGGGIPPEVQERLFQPFVSTRPAGKGTGLGLAMCHRIVQAHGGEIRVDSRLGEGTLVEVSLPLRRQLEEGAAQKAPVECAA
jgi:signal transduction histidine kinase